MDISQLLAEPLPDRPRASDKSHRRKTDPATLSRHNSTPTGSSMHSSPSRSRGSPTADRASKRRVCATCGHSFVSKAHLAIHDRTVHQRLKLYQCDICKTSFGQPGTLTRHKAAVHEKRRDHECTSASCKKRFGSRWTLSVHERNVHQKIKPYRCSVASCDRQFGNLWNQKKHESHVHNIQHPPSSNSGGRPSGSGSSSSSRHTEDKRASRR